MSQQQQNQLELPPVSFARYFELLKRRRWQVLPMSLVGLVVGAVVALLIPRYYVADTLLSYRGTPLDQASRTDDDPLYTKVRNADQAFRELVPRTLEELNRIGTDESDPSRQAIIDAARERLNVRAYEQGRDRAYYNINIEFKDVDGQFAADFCNTMRDLFVESIRTELEAEANVELRRANEDLGGLQQARDFARKALQSFLNRHPSIDPYDPDSRVKQGSTLAQMIVAAENEFFAVEAELNGKQAQIKKLDEQIKLQPPDEEVAQPVSADSELAKQVQPYLTRLRIVERKLSEFEKSHPDYEHNVRLRAHYEAEIARIAPDLGTGGVRLVKRENEKRKALIEKRNELELVVAEKQVLHDRLAARLEQMRGKFDEITSVYASYEELLAKKTDRDAEYAEARKQFNELDAAYARTRTGRPLVTVNVAQVPPVPTEPNALFVAATGCIVGLGAAIGLVLLLDFLRSTFKTVEDVSYGLKVPVLGTMAYLETAEDRIRNIRHRRSVSLVAASFVVLTLSLVTVYYVAPTRLPSAVLHALDTLLGASTAR